ncbi:MAG: homoserine kinase [Gaiellaceae bacterium]
MIVARAPASTANLGPGFDAAAAALDLWNHAEIEPGAFAVEIDGEGADELPRDATHLAVQAFGLLTPPDGYRFRFTNSIPLERGLGSSASAIGLGLVAGAVAGGHALAARDLLTLGVRLESHIDNLAAVLSGGVCIAWHENGPRVRRIADDVPADAIAVVPSERTSTAASRTALPEHVPHTDAAVTAGAAMLLGAALASGDADLLRHAFRDRLHEPYRGAGAPLLDAVKRLVPEALGVTLSGSGPTVIAWVADSVDRDRAAAHLASELGATADVLPLGVAHEGAAAQMH